MASFATVHHHAKHVFLKTLISLEDTSSIIILLCYVPHKHIFKWMVMLFLDLNLCNAASSKNIFRFHEAKQYSTHKSIQLLVEDMKYWGFLLHKLIKSVYDWEGGGKKQQV